MKTIKEFIGVKKSLPNKVLQFGEGNFLRAFIDWQLQQLSLKENFNGGVVIVQPLKEGMINALQKQNHLYTVLLEGILNGKKIQQSEIITNINDSVNPYSDFEKFMNYAEDDDLQFIFSNTTEAGIKFLESDKKTDTPPSTFPAKLTLFLEKRFQLGKKGFDILPCELIDDNGDELKACVLKYAELWNLGEDFKNYIEKENRFYSTLVDRIVPGFPKERAKALCEEFGYEDNLIVKAEPFMLYCIKGDKKIEDKLPFKKAGLNVVLTDDLEPYHDTKVRLLNGPHTTMVQVAQLAGLQFVNEVMNDKRMLQFITDEMRQEIAPMINLPLEKTLAYADAVVERFNNPYVQHALSAIALNSVAKFRTRLLPTLNDYVQNKKALPKHIVIALASLFVIYTGKAPNGIQPIDDPEVVKKFTALKDDESLVPIILSDEKLWGQNLTIINDLVFAVKDTINEILERGIENVVDAINAEGKNE